MAVERQSDADKSGNRVQENYGLRDADANSNGDGNSDLQRLRKKSVSVARSDTSYIFKGINQSAGGLLQKTEYEFIVSAEVDIGGQNVTIKSAALTSETHPPLVFGGPYVTRDNRDGLLSPPRTLASYEWRVLDSAQAKLGGTSWGPEPPAIPGVTRYRFAFEVPRATGLQVGSGPSTHQECVWGSSNLPAVTSDWKWWRSYVHLNSCGVGDGTSSITVKVKNIEHDYQWDAATILVRQAWHDADNQLDYQIDCAAMPAATAQLDFVSGIRTGAGAWNSAKPGVLFDEKNPNTCALQAKQGKITVEYYTAASAQADTCQKATALACVTPVDSNYPHTGTQRLLINGAKSWASIANPLTGAIPSGHSYLPYVMMHEFGHAAGLGHSANRADLMYRKYNLARNAVANSLTATARANGVSAMKSIYKTHATHN